MLASFSKRINHETDGHHSADHLCGSRAGAYRFAVNIDKAKLSSQLVPKAYGNNSGKTHALKSIA
jgi:hypothetical protein